MSFAIEQGEVQAVLADYQDNSFDALACDPPYGFSFMGKSWDYDVPSVALWKECLRVLKPGAPLLAFGGSRTYHRLACGIEDAGFELRDQLMWLYGKGFPKSLNLKNGWTGYGTALKPAHEPIILARKPLDGTVVENVTRWGVGALNIGGCRIGETGGTAWEDQGHAKDALVGAALGGCAPVSLDKGRWPANLMLDEEAGAMLDASTGPSKSTPYPEHRAEGAVLPLNKRTAGGYADSGGPSRFFYSGKVSTKEREAGCEGLALRSAGEVTEREDACPACDGTGRVIVEYAPHGLPPEGVLDNCVSCKGTGRAAGLESPRAGAGRTGGARNHHPTLKPISLTTWLTRLILPPTPGAVLLVPFAGAGSEMIGALKAGWENVFGIERDPEYVQIARARLAHWCAESEAA